MKPDSNTLRELANNLYLYDPETGHFWWREVPRRGRAKALKPAGWVSGNGYRILVICGRDYYAHRIAWLLVYGELPMMLDHKNGVKDDNRILNLRISTVGRNSANRGKPSNNTSGFKGAYAQNGKWKASIKYDKKQYHLGMFESKEAAHAAYCQKAREVFGEYWHE